MQTRFTAPENWQWNTNIVTREGQFVRGGWVLPEKPKALIVIFPGLSEFCEKYFETSRDLLARGFAVAAVEWRGQGLSWRHLEDRDKRHHDDFAHDVDDARAFLKLIPVPKNIPRIMLAHSMGGHIGLRTLHDDPDIFKAAVFTAPLLGLPISEWMVSGVAAFMHMMGQDDHYMPSYGGWSMSGFERNIRILTSDPDRAAMQRYWMTEQPALRMGGITAGWLRATLASMHIVRDHAYLKAIKTPCLMIAGGNEMIVSNTAIETAARSLPNAEFLSVSGALHEIMMEKDVYRAQFWAAFDSFVAKALTSR